MASHQIHIDNDTKSNFYLRVRSMPIINDSNAQGIEEDLCVVALTTRSKIGAMSIISSGFALCNLPMGMNMKMSYSAMLVLFLTLTIFTPPNIAVDFRKSPHAYVAPPTCGSKVDGICDPTRRPPYRPPPLHRSNFKDTP
ncbi:hypothetical protein VNO78_21786 [Psophocarpus tetragonolobus]|uniref:Transmembrane protein n=1 Tax=Psophocarpus tetragonolobus TaxID=3891 RepID=A0AAN9SC66_PSOTE